MVEAAIGLQQGLDENVFRIFAIATDAQHLPVDSILVLVSERFKVHLTLFYCGYFVVHPQDSAVEHDLLLPGRFQGNNASRFAIAQ